MVVVRWRPVCGKFLPWVSCVCYIRNVVLSYLLPVLQQHVYSVVVLQKLTHPACVRVHFVLQLVYPVV